MITGRGATVALVAVRTGAAAVAAPPITVTPG
jgi:hypothetical protein